MSSFAMCLSAAWPGVLVRCFLPQLVLQVSSFLHPLVPVCLSPQPLLMRRTTAVSLVAMGLFGPWLRSLQLVVRHLHCVCTSACARPWTHALVPSYLAPATAGVACPSWEEDDVASLSVTPWDENEVACLSRTGQARAGCPLVQFCHVCQCGMACCPGQMFAAPARLTGFKLLAFLGAGMSFSRAPVDAADYRCVFGGHGAGSWDVRAWMQSLDLAVRPIIV